MEIRRMSEKKEDGLKKVDERRWIEEDGNKESG